MEKKTIEKYDFRSIEEKWIGEWERMKIYKAEEKSERPKYYCLDTWAYPSADGVNVGYVKSFGGMDIVARYKRMKGVNVLYPVGWDTFGLPAENYAIKMGKHPKEVTQDSIENFRRQYRGIGLSYDWSREIDTSDQEYYRWTQWIFLKMFERGLAYRKKATVQWCPVDKTVLAKEGVVDGFCERCGSPVEQKEMMQWFFKVTDYAERLYDDIETLDWDEKYKNPHRSWIGKHIDENGEVSFRIHDWCISRQRYWGPPIPIVYCDRCGEVPVPEQELPVVLPNKVDFSPTGESPLAKDTSFVHTKCPSCGGEGRREVDTMDTFVSSGWYQFRFTDPHNAEEFASKEKLMKWGSVDHYQGTIEHLTAHLIYARFITKVLHDAGFVPFDEPFPKYTPVGVLVDKSGTKFSKRLGNSPDLTALTEQYGGDLLRLSCAYISPFDDISRWGESDIVPVERFRNRIWRIFKTKVDGKPHPTSGEVSAAMHRMIKEVEENIEGMKFNVAISKMMVFVTACANTEGHIDIDLWKTFVRVIAPFAPFIAEEMWDRMGSSTSVHREPWPEYDKSKFDTRHVTIGVQVNGKHKGEIEVAIDESEESVRRRIEEMQTVESAIGGRTVQDFIYIPGKIVNIVV